MNTQTVNKVKVGQLDRSLNKVKDAGLASIGGNPGQSTTTAVPSRSESSVGKAASKKVQTTRSFMKSFDNSSPTTELTNNLSYVSLGRATGSKLKRLKGSEMNDMVLDGRNTIGHGVESPYRERTPSFNIRRSSPATKLQTHFAIYKFIPRHNDELALNIGDAIHVEKIHEDSWYEGMNLKTGEQGIFPCKYASDILSSAGHSLEFSDNGVQFFLRFLGSVEVFEFKGNNVLCQAVAKVLNARKGCKTTDIPPCSLEIDHQGIRVTDHKQESEKRQSTRSLVGRLFNSEQKVPEAKYFFNLKDVTFCGCYPSSPRYFGFVTKHPSEHRFACHTFVSEFSTEPVAKAIGQAFRRFYTDYVERSTT